MAINTRESHSLFELFDLLSTVVARLHDAKGGAFRLMVKSDPESKQIRVQVCTPERVEFAITPDELRSTRLHASQGIDWRSALIRILETGFGRIDVEVSASGRRTITSWDVVTSHRMLQ